MPDLLGVVLSGFGIYQREYYQNADVHSRTSISNLRHDHLIDCARKKLSSSRFRFIKIGGRKMFDFQGKILIQFKKLKHCLRPSNIRTGQSVQIEMNGQMTLLGFDQPIPILTIGYVPDKTNTDVAGVFVTYSDQHQHWAHKISDDGQSLLPNRTPIYPTKPTNESNHQKRRVRIKGDTTLPPEPRRKRAGESYGVD